MEQRKSWGRAIATIQERYKDRQLACSVWVALVVRHQRGRDGDPYYSGGPDGEPQSAWWQDMQLQHGEWDCITALVSLGGEEVAPDELQPGSVVVAQYWRADFAKGHQVLAKVWPYAGSGGVGQTLWESQTSTGFVDRQATIEQRRQELARTYGGPWTVRVVQMSSALR